MTDIGILSYPEVISHSEERSSQQNKAKNSSFEVFVIYNALKILDYFCYLS